MTLARILSQHQVSLRLGLGGAPVTSEVPVVRWEDKGGQMRATVSFGPFMDRVTVDSVWVSFDGGEPERLDAAAGGAEFTLPAGMEWEYTLTLSTSTRQV